MMEHPDVLAAVALIALEENLPKLGECHSRALELATRLEEVPGLKVERERVETNFCPFIVTRPNVPAGVLVSQAAERGVLLYYTGSGPTVVGVTHVATGECDVERACAVIAEVMQR
jgi:threonine aldolase